MSRAFARQRRSPRVNVDASTFVQWLDSQREYVLDLDDVRRVYINNVWVTPTLKRTLRRYRNNNVKSIRPATAEQILSELNLTLKDFTDGSNA